MRLSRRLDLIEDKRLDVLKRGEERKGGASIQNGRANKWTFEDAFIRRSEYLCSYDTQMSRCFLLTCVIMPVACDMCS